MLLRTIDPLPLGTKLCPAGLLSAWEAPGQGRGFWGHRERAQVPGGCVRAPEPASVRQARRRAESLDPSKQYPFWIISNEMFLLTVPANILWHAALGPLFQDQRPGEAVGWVEGGGGAAHCPRQASLRSAPTGCHASVAQTRKALAGGPPAVLQGGVAPGGTRGFGKEMRTTARTPSPPWRETGEENSW